MILALVMNCLEAEEEIEAEAEVEVEVEIEIEIVGCRELLFVVLVDLKSITTLMNKRSREERLR